MPIDRITESPFDPNHKQLSHDIHRFSKTLCRLSILLVQYNDAINDQICCDFHTGPR